MKERPILFGPESVRAILEGRQTIVRRPVKNARGAFWDHGAWTPTVETDHILWRSGRHEQGMPVRSPFGVAGDKLWVRETWMPRIAHSHGQDACDCADLTVLYPADGLDRFIDARDVPNEWLLPKGPSRNLSGVVMPHWASRITLDVMSVRVERVQGITPADAVAEGAAEVLLDAAHPLHRRVYEERGYAGAIDAFAVLWDSIYSGAASWSSNPWTWRVEFKREVRS